MKASTAQKFRPPHTCSEYRIQARRLGMSVWALREQDRQDWHTAMRRTLGKNWKPVPRNADGFLIRREEVNGRWVERLEYPGKTAVENWQMRSAAKNSEGLEHESSKARRKVAQSGKKRSDRIATRKPR